MRIIKCKKQGNIFPSIILFLRCLLGGLVCSFSNPVYAETIHIYPEENKIYFSITNEVFFIGYFGNDSVSRVFKIKFPPEEYKNLKEGLISSERYQASYHTVDDSLRCEEDENLKPSVLILEKYNSLPGSPIKGRYFFNFICNDQSQVEISGKFGGSIPQPVGVSSD